MSIFDQILNGLKQKIDAHTAYKKAVIESIQEILSTTITEDSIGTLKDGVLTLSLHPTLKSALLLKQDAFFKALQTRGYTVSRIR